LLHFSKLKNLEIKKNDIFCSKHLRLDIVYGIYDLRSFELDRVEMFEVGAVER
jgi:hypothetical protein